MKAIRIHSHGGPDVLQVDEIEKPSLERGHVLVNIKFAALNHLDLWVRKGIPGIPLPLIMGSDASGIIGDSGDSDQFKTGDEVFLVPFRTPASCPSRMAGHDELCRDYQIPGEQIDGYQAEYVSVPSEYVMKKPPSLTLAEAAAFPLTFLTAYHMLAKKIRIGPRDRVLIWGGASGVGSAAIQIAKLFGAFVISTAGSDHKADFCRELGCDDVINYNKKDVGKYVREICGGHGVDYVIEHPGESSWMHSMRALKKGGTIVTCGATTGPVVSLDLRSLFIKHLTIIGSTMGNRDDMAAVAQLTEEKKIKPVIYKEFSYGDVRKAHEILESGEHSGKVIIDFRR